VGFCWGLWGKLEIGGAEGQIFCKRIQDWYWLVVVDLVDKYVDKLGRGGDLLWSLECG
jgi:hypothetical protein